MRSQEIVITPAWAEWALSTQNFNRRIRQAKVVGFSQQMESGRWLFTHQGPAFTGRIPLPEEVSGPQAPTTNGVHLCDGQHKLAGVARSGVEIPFWVTWGVPEECVGAIDVDLSPRTVLDSLLYSGAIVATTDGAAIANVIENGEAAFKSRSFRLHMQRREFFQKHLDAIEFTCMAFSKKKRGTQAPIRGVVGRAYYKCDAPLGLGFSRERLVEFAQVVATGIPVSERHQDDAGALLLRSLSLGIRLAGDQARLELYRKAQRALLAFLNREPIRRLYAAEGDLF